MNKEINPMDKFDFLIGKWKLKYNVPKSFLSDEDTGEGTGEFKRILNNKYVSFDYSAKLSKGEGSAHAIFAWDDKSKLYKFWWFEDSGNYSSATCNFIDDDTLCLNWHDSLLVQSFKKENSNKIILRMKYPANENKYDLVLEVTFTK
jgi:hypothetical protein